MIIDFFSLLPFFFLQEKQSKSLIKIDSINDLLWK